MRIYAFYIFAKTIVHLSDPMLDVYKRQAWIMFSDMSNPFALIFAFFDNSFNSVPFPHATSRTISPSLKSIISDSSLICKRVYRPSLYVSYSYAILLYAILDSSVLLFISFSYHMHTDTFVRALHDKPCMRHSRHVWDISVFCRGSLYFS